MASQAAGRDACETKTISLTDRELRYLAEWLRTQMTDEAESLLLKLDCIENGIDPNELGGT